MPITALIAAVVFSAVLWKPIVAGAATNSANNVAGGSHTLTGSGNVTVNAATLQLVKQVWTTGGTCLASAPADATCNSSATATTLPTGTTVKFLIFVKNTTDINLTDIRFQDLLDDTASGFTYVATSIKRTQTGASEPLDTDTSSTIYTNANTGTALTDAVANADVAGIDTAVSPDNLSVGGAGGVGQNATLAVNAHKAFAVLFQATKN